MRNELEDDRQLSWNTVIHSQVLRIEHGPLHNHPKHLEILLVLDGSVWVKDANRIHERGAGELAFINSGNIHCLWSPGSATILQTHLDLEKLERFYPGISSELFGNLPILGPEYPPSATGRVRAISFQRYLIRQYMEREHLRNDRPSDNVHRLIALLQAEFDFMNHLFPKKKYVGPETTTRVRRTIRFLRSSYNEKLTLESVAEREGISSAYFTQAWKETISIPLYRFINMIRAVCSEQALLEGRGRLLDIALSYGFSDERYYHKDFTSWFGVRPLEWKRRWKAYASERDQQEILNRERAESLLAEYQQGRIADANIETRLYGQYKALQTIEESGQDLSGVRVVLDLFSRDNLPEKEDPNSLPEWNSIELLLPIMLKLNLPCCVRIRLDAMRIERLKNGFFEFVKKAIRHEGIRTISRWEFQFICENSEDFIEAREYIVVLRQVLPGCSTTIALE